MHGDPICLNERDSLARIKEVLEECKDYPFKHQAFPVVQRVDEEGMRRRARPLRGVISRKQLNKLLSNHKQMHLHIHPIEREDGEGEATINLIPCAYTPCNYCIYNTLLLSPMSRYQPVAVHSVAKCIHFFCLPSLPPAWSSLAHCQYGSLLLLPALLLY